MKLAGRIWVLITGTAVLILLSGCSPRTGGSLLSFFFDGVPGTDSMEISIMTEEETAGDSIPGSAGIQEEQGRGMIVHYPYQEKECGSCHDQTSLGQMVEPEPGLCYTCHEDLGNLYAYLHGPVAGGYCTSCHNPHMSESQNLLRYSGEDLCYYCHRSSSVLQNEIHQDLEGMSCTDCHNPHGGEDRFIFH